MDYTNRGGSVIFLKLGGSLITHKDKAESARIPIIRRLAREVANALSQDESMQIVVGHGSGSFGHHAAQQHGTADGSSTREDWLGFTEVWRSAQQLNRIVCDELRNAGLPVVNFSPSASSICQEGLLEHMAIEPILRALSVGLIPLTHGDVAFDRIAGSAILSTEQIFQYLSARLQPQRILLAGLDAGVYQDPSRPDDIQPQISPADLEKMQVEGSQAIDVTGGMAAKVQLAIAMIQANPDLEISIFSGEEPGAVEAALLGAQLGTLIVA
jgi:isopentenyl phosphate kinase